MSRSKQPFKPRVEGKVGMYVCGVTAYDLSHIGHARVYVTFDVLYRYLQHLKFEVFYVRNFTDVDDKVIDLYHPLALRLFLSGTHYRSPINYSNAQLEVASDRLYYIYQTLRDCEEILKENNGKILEDSAPSKDTLDCIAKFHSEFENSMSDDLHTPVALAALSEPLKSVDDLLHTRKGRKQLKRIESIFAIEKIVKNVLTILGLVPSSYNEVLQQLREKALKRAGRTEDQVLEKIEERNTQRKNKEFEKSDIRKELAGVLQQLREKALKRGLTEDQVLEKIEERNTQRKNKEFEKSEDISKELAAVGIALMDSSQGTTWRPGIPLDLQEKIAST